MKQLPLAFALCVGLSVCGACAQTAPSPAPVKPLAYELVSVKVNKSESGMMMWKSTLTGVKMENVCLRDLSSAGYALDSPMEEQITCPPNWAEETRFDIKAKASEEDREAYKKLNFERQTPLLLAAVEDRFKLKAHEETRELPTYSLEVAKGGPKIQPAKEGDTYETGLKPSGPGTMSMNMNGSNSLVEFHALPMKNLGDNLSYQVHRKGKVDTGIAGKYDIKLSRSLEDAKNPAVLGFFTAVQKQLGLKLVPAKGPVECVVVDHVEETTES